MRSYRVDEDKPLNAGLLRHRITWQRKVTPTDQAAATQNSFGEDASEWVDVLTCAAQVKQMGAGGESARNGQRWAEDEYQILQHYSKGLLTSDRILWKLDGVVRVLDVLTIGDRAGVGRTLDITAKEHIADQAAA